MQKTPSNHTTTNRHMNSQAYSIAYFRNRVSNLPNSFSNELRRLESNIRRKPLLHAYWCNYNNAGDQLTPLLLKKFGHFSYCVEPHEASLISVGSILEHVPQNYGGLILGAGFISAKSQYSFPNAKILGLRGRHTMAAAKISLGSVVLGDPGLLSDSLIKKQRSMKYDLGVIPHYIDAKSHNIAELVKRYPSNIKYIDIATNNVNSVLEQISQCKAILSSSLHGLIFADSLGKPSGWFDSPGLDGGRFKFGDYYSIFPNFKAECISIKGDEKLTDLLKFASLKPADEIAKVKENISGMFENL